MPGFALELNAFVLVAGLAAVTMAAAAGEKHPPARPGGKWSSIRLVIPARLKAEQEELHAEVVRATQAGDRVGAAAKAVAELLHPHFSKEKALALPLLPRLPSGCLGERSPVRAGIRVVCRSIAPAHTARAHPSWQPLTSRLHVAMFRCTRTTLTLENDVAGLLEEVHRERGGALKTVVNEALRLGLQQLSAPPPPREPYRIRPVDAGPCHLANVDDIAEVLAVCEGEDWR